MKRVLAVVAALVLAAIGALAVLGYAGAADARAVAGQEATTVYVTTRLVPAGTPLDEAVSQGMLEKTVFPARSVPAGALLRVDTPMQSLIATSEIAAGEIVLERRFGSQQVGDAALVVPEGKVAVTIELTDPARVGPFLRPGSQIAVYDTFEARNPDDGDYSPTGTALGGAGSVNATNLVLGKVTVLAVGDVTLTGRAQAAGGGGVLGGRDEVPTALVTVALDPPDVPRLVHAANTGVLYAVLLGSGADLTGGAVDDRRMFEGAP